VLAASEENYYETKPFEFGHLQNPVPASVYLDARDDYWGEQSHCTLTDDSHRPKLLFRNHVRHSLLLYQYACQLPTLADPPVTLLPIDTLDSDSEAPPFTVVAAHATPTCPIKEDRPNYSPEPPATAPRPGPGLFREQWPRPTGQSRNWRETESDFTNGHQDTAVGDGHGAGDASRSGRNGGRMRAGWATNGDENKDRGRTGV
jgi:hypothetical protein